jgi:hypothetical protein
VFRIFWGVSNILECFESFGGVSNLLGVFRIFWGCFESFGGVLNLLGVFWIFWGVFQINLCNLICILRCFVISGVQLFFGGCFAHMGHRINSWSWLLNTQINLHLFCIYLQHIRIHSIILEYLLNPSVSELYNIQWTVYIDYRVYIYWNLSSKMCLWPIFVVESIEAYTQA